MSIKSKLEGIIRVLGSNSFVVVSNTGVSAAYSDDSKKVSTVVELLKEKGIINSE